MSCCSSAARLRAYGFTERVAMARDFHAHCGDAIEQFLRCDELARALAKPLDSAARTDPPTRIAVSLIGAPGNAAAMFAIGFPARRKHRVAELQVVLQHILIKRFGKRVCRVIVHRPTGGDDTAHADLDELARDAVGQPIVCNRACVNFAR